MTSAINSRKGLPDEQTRYWRYGGYEPKNLAPNSPYDPLEIFKPKAAAIDDLMSTRSQILAVEDYEETSAARYVMQDIRKGASLGEDVTNMSVGEYESKFYDLWGRMIVLDEEMVNAGEFGRALTIEEQRTEDLWRAFYPISIRDAFPLDLEADVDPPIASMLNAILQFVVKNEDNL